jgi:uncharacterized membrane protein YgcG
MNRRVQRLVKAVVAAIVLLVAIGATADSQVRIVRLSAVEGYVMADRHTGQGFEPALVNMPITQGMLLHTGEDGYAEVEFEEGTTVRLAPNTQVDFQELSLRDSGGEATTVRLSEGTAYLDVRRLRGDNFTLAVAEQDLPVTRATHFRVEFAGHKLKLAVYGGDLRVKRDGSQVKVKKGEELTLDLAENSSLLAKDITPSPYDSWDEQRSRYHQQYYSDSDYSSYPYYGRGDLNYYGSWYDVAGYGSLWQPYGMTLGWSPFGAGYWGWYPGFGYTWISPYPWGWLPFHYGSWVWVPGWGWGWLPGAYWGPWGRFPIIVNPPTGFVAPRPPRLPNRPLIPPTTGPNRSFLSIPGLPAHNDLIASSGTQTPAATSTPIRPPMVTAPPFHNFQGGSMSHSFRSGSSHAAGGAGSGHGGTGGGGGHGSGH